VLFGLIMVLTFTGSLSAAESGRSEVRTMLIGALGCNLAWGLIDAIMYLMSCLSDQAADSRTMRAIRTAATPREAGLAIARILPPLVASVIAPAELQRITAELARAPAPTERPRLQSRHWLGAVAVFLLVFSSTIPVVLPFMLLHDATVALRISNGIAVFLMFVAGYAFGQLAGYRPLVTAGSMVLLGALLVALTIALGG
jgi:VIT1/CCC1 family predicted Fe2+/Mn2+ transporter